MNKHKKKKDQYLKTVHGSGMQELGFTAKFGFKSQLPKNSESFIADVKMEQETTDAANDYFIF